MARILGGWVLALGLTGIRPALGMSPLDSALTVVGHVVQASPSRALPDSALSAAWPQFNTYLAANHDARTGTTGSVKIGFDGSEVDGRSTYTLDTTILIEKGQYPDQTRVMTRTRARFTDNELAEDISAFLINRDHYLTPRIEIYGFAERFSDDFMSIDQRIEVGIGMLKEWHLFQDKEPNTQFNSISQGLDGLKARQGAAAPAVLAPAIALLSEENEKVRAFRSQKQAKLLTSLAGSLFFELEGATLKSVVDTVNAGGETVRGASANTVSRRAPRTHRVRLTLRPEFEAAVYEGIGFQGRSYFKLPLDPPFRTDDDRIDARIETELALTFKLDGESSKADQVKFELKLRHLYDTAPPAVDADIGDTVDGRSLVLRDPIARDAHWLTSLGVVVSF